MNVDGSRCYNDRSQKKNNQTEYDFQRGRTRSEEVRSHAFVRKGKENWNKTPKAILDGPI